MKQKIALFAALLLSVQSATAKDLCIKKLLYGIDDIKNTEYIKIENIKSLKKIGSTIPITGIHFHAEDPSTTIYPFTGAAYVMKDGSITFSYRGIVVEHASQQLANGVDIMTASNTYTAIDCQAISFP